MKLRNKKTGEIINSKEVLTDEFIINLFSKDFNYFISELDKIQEEWEDVEEPLIKDEKIRKAVRAWAEALDFKNDEHIFLTKPEYHARVLDVEKGLFTMSIPYDEENIEDVCNLPYTIAELCGEEE